MYIHGNPQPQFRRLCLFLHHSKHYRDVITASVKHEKVVATKLQLLSVSKLGDIEEHQLLGGWEGQQNASGQDVHGQVMEIRSHNSEGSAFFSITPSTIEMSSLLRWSMKKWWPPNSSCCLSASLEILKSISSSTKLLRPTVKNLSCKPTEPVRWSDIWATILLLHSVDVKWQEPM